MSAYRMSLVYQDSDKKWWFGVAPSEDWSPWFDNLIYVGPCAAREEALACSTLFENTGYVPDELGPPKLLSAPPSNKRWTIDERMNEVREERRRIHALLGGSTPYRCKVDADFRDALMRFIEESETEFTAAS